MSSRDPSILELFERLVPVTSLRRSSQADLARKAMVLRHAAGDYLFRVGDTDPSALYLIQGQIELIGQWGGEPVQVEGGSPEAQHRLAHQLPRRFDARCLGEVVCLKLDGRLLDVMLTYDQSDSFEVSELHALDPHESDDWMTRLLQTPAFQMVPPTNLQAMFLRMQRLDAVPGQVIIRQGEDGDYFYVITDGRCLVTREQPNQRAVRLAELEAGSCFGEEALIADSPRNATVTMLTQGTLMRLAKQDFRTLLKEPLTRHVDAAEAARRVGAGQARYLDVRLPSEFLNRHLPGSLNVPLYMLRMRLAQLDPQGSYICVCDTGRRSAVAAFVLTQKGYDSLILDGGLAAT